MMLRKVLFEIGKYFHGGIDESSVFKIKRNVAPLMQPVVATAASLNHNALNNEEINCSS